VSDSSSDRQTTRRRFGAAVGSAFGALALGDACVVATREAADQARLTNEGRHEMPAAIVREGLQWMSGR
jgi:hypothetical protein